MNTKPRKKRFNRFVRVLAELYDMSYHAVLHHYNNFNRDVKVTQLHLKRIVSAGHQLDFIDDINLSY